MKKLIFVLLLAASFKCFYKYKDENLIRGIGDYKDKFSTFKPICKFKLNQPHINTLIIIPTTSDEDSQNEIDITNKRIAQRIHYFFKEYKNFKYRIIGLKDTPSSIVNLSVDILFETRMVELIFQNRHYYDAFVPMIFIDSAYKQAKEISEEAHVVAPCLSSVLTAALLGHKFTIVIEKKDALKRVTDNITAYGFDKYINNFVYFYDDENTRDINKKGNEARYRKRALKVSHEAIRTNSDVIIWGLLDGNEAFVGIQEILQITVIDPIVTSVHYAKIFAEMKEQFGWSISKYSSYSGPEIDFIQEHKDFRNDYFKTDYSRRAFKNLQIDNAYNFEQINKSKSKKGENDIRK
jgi:Asp/Glu/hydantoin racemase